MTMPPTDLTIEVTAKQFNFQITYPGADGQFGTADDKTFLDEMHVPVGRPVRVNLKAQDVIHSLFVPQFRFKQDLVPGREIAGWFEVTKPGTYEAPCAELCGFGHSGMRAWVHAHTAEDFATWAAEHLKPAAPAAARAEAGEPMPVTTRRSTP
jgi:cytochrome c oxidase subunit 2